MALSSNQLTILSSSGPKVPHHQYRGSFGPTVEPASEYFFADNRALGRLQQLVCSVVKHESFSSRPTEGTEETCHLDGYTL